VDVASYADSIATGNFKVNFGGYLSNFGGSDLPEMRILFLDENDFEIGSSPALSTLNPSWTLFSESMLIPQQTTTIQLELKGTRFAGTDNDSYFDDLFLTLGDNDFDCNNLTSVNELTLKFQTLEVVPNPVQSTGMIVLPKDDYGAVSCSFINAVGAKVEVDVEYRDGRVYFDFGELGAGVYVFWVRGDGIVLGSGKVVVL